MHPLYALVIIASVFVFLTCTLPGFLHITNIHKSKNIPIVCIGLGAIFGIELLFHFFHGPRRCMNPRCKCTRCNCGPHCRCDGSRCSCH